MARGNLTIYDVPAEIRARGAAEARKSLHQMMSNPHLSAEQRADLTKRLQWCSKWETLNVTEVLEKPAPTPLEIAPTEPPPSSTAHVVEVSESLTVEEG